MLSSRFDLLASALPQGPVAGRVSWLKPLEAIFHLFSMVRWIDYVVWSSGEAKLDLLKIIEGRPGNAPMTCHRIEREKMLCGRLGRNFVATAEEFYEGKAIIVREWPVAGKPRDDTGILGGSAPII